MATARPATKTGAAMPGEYPCDKWQTVLHIVSSCPRTAAASLSLRVNVLCPNQHKLVISETFFPANLMASTEETKPNTPTANIHSEHKNITTQK